MTIPIGPSFIALQVRDLATSAAFYKDVFGFTAADRNPPGAVVFTTRPIALALREPLRTHQSACEAADSTLQPDIYWRPTTAGDDPILVVPRSLTVPESRRSSRT